MEPIQIFSSFEIGLEVIRGICSVTLGPKMDTLQEENVWSLSTGKPNGTEAAGAMDLFASGFFLKELFLRNADVINGQRTGSRCVKPMCRTRD